MFAVRRSDDIFHQWNRKYMFLNFMAGFLGVFCTQLMFCLGLKTSEPRFTAPWMLLNPIFVTILALICGYEKSEKIKTIGLCTSIAGTICLIFLKSQSVGMVYKPVTFLFISSICNASGIILWRKLLLDYGLSSVVVATWSLLVGTVFMTISYILEPYWFNQVAFHDLGTSLNGCKEIMFCCFVIMLGYAVTYGLMTWATHKSSISIVALYAAARPLFTVALSFIINKDKLLNTFLSAFFLFIVLIGLLASSYSKKKAKQAKREESREKMKERLAAAFAEFPMATIEVQEHPEKVIRHN
jgi:drug/metabolite transporter (DMT)-like permease